MTTITREKMNELAGGVLTDAQMNNIAAYFGIAIADPEPPEAMVKLADAICDDAFPDGWSTAHTKGALAALQFADKVVREADDWSANGTLIERNDIRRKLGAIA